MSKDVHVEQFSTVALWPDWIFAAIAVGEFFRRGSMTVEQRALEDDFNVRITDVFLNGDARERN